MALPAVPVGSEVLGSVDALFPAGGTASGRSSRSEHVGVSSRHQERTEIWHARAQALQSPRHNRPCSL